MKPILLIICCLCAVGAFAQQQQEKKKPRVVISSAPNEKVDEDIMGLFRDELSAGLKKTGQYQVYEQRKEATFLQNEEREFQESGRVKDEDLMKLAKADGVDYVAYVTIRKIYTKLTITVKFMHLESMESIGEPITENGNDAPEDIISMADRIARKLAIGRSITHVSKKEYYTCSKCCKDERSGDFVDCDISAVSEQALTHTEALEFCKKKGDGWRLPTREELGRIFRQARDLVAEGAAPFEKKDYWSADTRNNYEAYFINFGTFEVNHYGKSIVNTFRCIRSD